MRGPLLPSGTRGPGDRTPLSTGTCRRYGPNTDGARRPHALLNPRSVRRQMERDRGNNDLGRWTQSTAQAGGRATVQEPVSTPRGDDLWDDHRKGEFWMLPVECLQAADQGCDDRAVRRDNHLQRGIRSSRRVGRFAQSNYRYPYEWCASAKPKGPRRKCHTRDHDLPRTTPEHGRDVGQNDERTEWLSGVHEGQQ